MTSLLVLNAGSSSLKFAVFRGGPDPACSVRGQVAGIGSSPRFELAGDSEISLAQGISLSDALAVVLDWLSDNSFAANAFDAIAHRIVHGGLIYSQPTKVDVTVLQHLEELRALAPLHLPSGLGVLRSTFERFPDVPHIACFDTAFHATQNPLATRLPLPRAYHERGYRRYGFHGLNYEHIVHALPRLTGKPLPSKLLVAHLGSGASMCAIVDGKSAATTMGFSTADGLVMGTRTGSIDPGVLIALMRDDDLSLKELEDLLYRRSGLLGISGISADMRVLLASDAPEAQEAIATYCYSAARHAGSLITAMGGIDALVFTGGVGEHAAPIRARIVQHLAWLGLSLNETFNNNNSNQIHSDCAIQGIYVICADEEATIARNTLLFCK